MTYPPDPTGFGWADLIIALILLAFVAAIVLICIVAYRIIAGM